MRARLSGAVAAGTLAIFGQILAGAQQNRAAQQPRAANDAQVDIEAGRRVYGANCAGCHGPNGDGVGTVNLRSGQFRRVGTDQELSALITNGIAGTGRGRPGARSVHRRAEVEIRHDRRHR